MGHLRVTVGHPTVTIGHLRATMGHLRLSIGYLKATVVNIRVTLGHLRVTIVPLYISKFSTNTCTNSTVDMFRYRLLRLLISYYNPL